MSVNLRESFYRELAKKDQQLNLAYAALLFAEYLTQAFNNSWYLASLDKMAETIETQVTAAPTDTAKIDVLNHHLFTELKFAGNIKNYYQPDNSFLNKVLDTRLGIPISLCVVYLEVGWRLGLPLWGINMPGHFIVGYGPASDPLYIDVFGRGRILSEAECLAISQGRIIDARQPREIYLKPAPKKAIIYRMLLNVKQIYVRAERWESAYKVTDLMLAVPPRRPNDIRDRGLLAYRLNRLRDATADLERYLFLTPNSPDADWLKEHLEKMEEKLLRLN